MSRRRITITRLFSSTHCLERHDIVQRRIGRIKEAPHAARRLAEALLILDQRDADIAFAFLAEADAGRDRDMGSR